MRSRAGVIRDGEGRAERVRGAVEEASPDVCAGGRGAGSVLEDDEGDVADRGDRRVRLPARVGCDVQRIGDAELRRGSGRIHHIEEDVVVGSRRPDALERDDLAPARERGDRRVLQGVMSGPGVEVGDGDRRQDCSGRRDRHIGDVGSVGIDGVVGVAVVLKDHAEAAVQACRDRRHLLMGAGIEDVAIGQGCGPDLIEDRDDRIGVGGAAEVVRLIGDDKTAVGQQCDVGEILSAADAVVATAVDVDLKFRAGQKSCGHRRLLS